MIRLFTQNMVLQVLLILVALLLLWTPALINPQPMPEGDALLYSLLRRVMEAVPLLAVIIAILLVLTEGVLLNLLLNDAGIVPNTSLLPTLLYVTAASATATSLTPILLVNLVLLGCLRPLIVHGTPLTIPTSKKCTATALIGIASLLCLPAAAFMLTYMLVAANYRLYGWRDWVAMILGFLAPYVMLVAILTMSGGLDGWWNHMLDSFSGIGIRIGETSALKMAANITILLIMVVALFGLWGRLNEKTVIWKKNASTVMLFTVGGIVILFYTQALPAEPANFAIPFALCGTHLMLPRKSSLTLGKKKRHIWFYDLLLTLTLIAAFLC